MLEGKRDLVPSENGAWWKSLFKMNSDIDCLLVYFISITNPITSFNASNVFAYKLELIIISPKLFSRTSCSCDYCLRNKNSMI